MKRWFADLESWWCGHGYRGGDSVLGVGTRSAQIRKVEVHVTFGVGLGHECGVRTGTMYPLRRAAIDPLPSFTCSEVQWQESEWSRRSARPPTDSGSAFAVVESLDTNGSNVHGSGLIRPGT